MERYKAIAGTEVPPAPPLPPPAEPPAALGEEIPMAVAFYFLLESAVRFFKLPPRALAENFRADPANFRADSVST